MVREFEKLVEFIELSNLYQDLAEETLESINFDSSPADNHKQILFFIYLENSLDSLAQNTYQTFDKELDPIDNFNFKFKWIKLSEIKVIKNIIKSELMIDGLIPIIEDSKEKIFSISDANLISTNKSNNLKKFLLILNKYKSFKELLRKTLYEC